MKSSAVFASIRYHLPLVEGVGYTADRITILLLVFVPRALLLYSHFSSDPLDAASPGSHNKISYHHRNQVAQPRCVGTHPRRSPLWLSASSDHLKNGHLCRFLHSHHARHYCGSTPEATRLVAACLHRIVVSSVATLIVQRLISLAGFPHPGWGKRSSSVVLLEYLSLVSLGPYRVVHCDGSLAGSGLPPLGVP